MIDNPKSEFAENIYRQLVCDMFALRDVAI